MFKFRWFQVSSPLLKLEQIFEGVCLTIMIIEETKYNKKKRDKAVLFRNYIYIGLSRQKTRRICQCRAEFKVMETNIILLLYYFDVPFSKCLWSTSVNSIYISKFHIYIYIFFNKLFFLSIFVLYAIIL